MVNNWLQNDMKWHVVLMHCFMHTHWMGNGMGSGRINSISIALKIIKIS